MALGSDISRISEIARPHGLPNSMYSFALVIFWTSCDARESMRWVRRGIGRHVVRFVSLPGGCPSAEMLWQRCHERALIGLDQDDLAIELAQHLLARQSVLVDVAAALGCHCSGVTAKTPGRTARVAVMSLEPPRTTSPVVDSSAVPSLDASPFDGAEPASPGSGLPTG